MSTYQTDEEQLEAIKQWWKDNGKSVIGGVVLGLAVVGGLKGWQQYTQARGENAAAYYSSFAVSAQGDDNTQALAEGERLLTEYGDSAYAVFASLEMARLAYRADDIDAALLHLQWVVDNAKQAPLKALGQLRMTKLYVDQGNFEKALALTAASETYFGAEYAVITGDIAVAQEDAATAKAAYQSALEQNVSNPALVRVKLVDLGE